MTNDGMSNDERITKHEWRMKWHEPSKFRFRHFSSVPSSAWDCTPGSSASCFCCDSPTQSHRSRASGSAFPSGAWERGDEGKSKIQNHSTLYSRANCSKESRPSLERPLSRTISVWAVLLLVSSFASATMRPFESYEYVSSTGEPAGRLAGRSVMQKLPIIVQA